jgi:hypothetical protein
MQAGQHGCLSGGGAAACGALDMSGFPGQVVGTPTHVGVPVHGKGQDVRSAFNYQYSIATAWWQQWYQWYAQHHTGTTQPVVMTPPLTAPPSSMAMAAQDSASSRDLDKAGAAVAGGAMPLTSRSAQGSDGGEPGTVQGGANRPKGGSRKVRRLGPVAAAAARRPRLLPPRFARFA